MRSLDRFWSKVDESILIQKSRINWISLGDSNSKKKKFTAIKIRKARNRLAMLYNEHDEALTDTAEIQEEIVNFY